MTQLAQKILDEALTLSLDERSRIVDRLLVSLDEPLEAGAQEAWSDEIRHRVEALDSGQAQTVPWEEAEAMIFGDPHGLPSPLRSGSAPSVESSPKPTPVEMAPAARIWSQ